MTETLIGYQSSNGIIIVAIKQVTPNEQLVKAQDNKNK